MGESMQANICTTSMRFLTPSPRSYPLFVLSPLLFNVCRVSSEGIFVFWYYELNQSKFARHTQNTANRAF